jgi:DNA-binding CsgD family transcriptional regulator
MANESLQDPPAKSRQDQILLLAAEGMTDKEIASKLSLSPETVGTYWRRILSKYSAASRTEVVAKVVRLQAKASINEISEVNECLREVTDHLLLELSGRQTSVSGDHAGLAALAIELLSSYVLILDGEGFVHYANRSIGKVVLTSGEPFEWSILAADRDGFRDALGKVLNGEVESTPISFNFVNESDEPVKFAGTAKPIFADDMTMALLEVFLV